MSKYLEVTGNGPLEGEVTVSGSKNAALPILFTSLLTAEECQFENVPSLDDVHTTIKLLRLLGCDVVKEGSRVRMCMGKLISNEAPYELVRTMRASILALGPLVARFGEARISLPGGCAIGARPVDMHLVGLEKLGATIQIKGGYVEASAKRLKGATISFRRITVTGTENLMMAATLAEGTTVLENAAREPEIVDLAISLRKMGARIRGEGTKRIEIDGVSELKGCSHFVSGDRIEAGTLLCAAMVTRGRLTLRGVPMECVNNLLPKVEQSGCSISSDRGALTIDARRNPLRAVDICTNPYPGFPTDMQAQWMVTMLSAHGESRVIERVFENRFMHVAELRRLGAEIIEENSHTCLINGPQKLYGAPVMATDLRASASLVIAALAAEGVTSIDRIYHLDRGYERFEEKLQSVGAKVRRIESRSKLVATGQNSGPKTT